MDATEKALAKKTATEITVREISVAAGANEAMVRYYFGSKEGLLITMLQNFMNDGPYARDKEILELCVNSKSIGPLVDAISDFYYSHPNVMRMIIVETFNATSEVKNAYMKRYSHSTCNLVQTVIDGMKEAGIYRDDIDTAFMTQSLIRLIIWPIMQPTDAGVPGAPPQAGDSNFAAYVARTIDSEAKL
jgi:AcrR family transcriptional regulator